MADVFGVHLSYLSFKACILQKQIHVLFLISKNNNIHS